MRSDVSFYGVCNCCLTLPLCSSRASEHMDAQTKHINVRHEHDKSDDAKWCEGDCGNHDTNHHERNDGLLLVAFKLSPFDDYDEA